MIPTKSLLKDGEVVNGQKQFVWRSDGVLTLSDKAAKVMHILSSKINDFDEMNNDYFYYHLNQWCQLYEITSIKDYVFDVFYTKNISNLIGYLIKMAPIEMPKYEQMAS